MAATTFASLDEVRATVGRPLGTSDWVEVDQARVDRFAEATGDRQWIHVDVARARRESPFGGPIAHGSDLVACDEVRGGIQTTIRVTVEVEGGDKPVCVVDALSRWLA